MDMVSVQLQPRNVVVCMVKIFHIFPLLGVLKVINFSHITSEILISKSKIKISTRQQYLGVSETSFGKSPGVVLTLTPTTMRCGSGG